MNHSDLKGKVKKELIKSGFPLEIYCDKIFYKSRWGVSHCTQFFYPDGNLGDIDGWASKQDHWKTNNMNITFFFEVFLECKKNESSPWVFFGERLFPELNIMSNSKVINNLPPFDYYKSAKKHHYLSADISSRLYAVPFGSDKAKQQIYEAVTKLINCYSYHKKKRLWLKRSPRQRLIISLCNLLIVFDGILFSASVSHNDIILNERKHILLHFGQQGTENVYEYFTIDIVQKNYLEKYLNLLNADFPIVKSYFNNRIAHYKNRK